MSMLETSHNRNSQQKEMGWRRSRYFWEGALRYSTKRSSRKQTRGIFCFFKGNISLLPSRKLYKKKFVQFHIQLLKLELNLILPMIKTIWTSLVFGLLRPQTIRRVSLLLKYNHLSNQIDRKKLGSCTVHDDKQWWIMVRVTRWVACWSERFHSCCGKRGEKVTSRKNCCGKIQNKKQHPEDI